MELTQTSGTGQELDSSVDGTGPMLSASPRASERPLVEIYDTALLDLDGVIYVGPRPVEHAAEALAEARSRGMRVGFVTNNASRTPQAVAAHLVELGVAAQPEDVVTSAQAAARLVREQVPPGSAVLVIGGEGIIEALREQGLRPVRSCEEQPAAVVQGYAPDVGWRQLAEGAFAVRRGLPWIATNLDLTLPTPRGPAPGNGALVAAVRAATGAEPRLVAGKPHAPLFHETVVRIGARRPLVVGDRLDTDIEGANNVGADSLLVMTGATTPRDLLAAPAHRRPTYIAADLRGLLAMHPPVQPAGDGWRCGRWTAWVRDGELHVARAEGVAPPEPTDACDGLRALCAAAWSSQKPPEAEEALRILGL